jgi:hypothetical protein
MINSKSNSYYISDVFLNSWTFRHTSNNEILYELYNNQNKKIYSGKLADECREDFVVNIGEQNDIHIVIRKISGDIIYYFFNGKKWNTQKLYNLNQHKDSFRLLSLHFWKNKTHLLYNIKGASNTNNWMWVDQYWEDKTWKHNKFFQAEIKNHTTQYASTQDISGNIYFISQWWDGVNNQIEYFQFHSNVSLWNKNSLTFKKGEKYAPNIWLTEDTHKIHTCWISKKDEKYTLCYRNKDIGFTDGSQWNKEQEVYSSINKIDSPFFAEINNALSLYWIEKNILYYLRSNDLGESWEISHTALAELSNPYLFNYISKKTKNNDRSSNIVLDHKNLRTYPLSFITKQNDDTTKANQTGAINTFYPSPRSHSNTDKSKFFNFADRTFDTKKMPFPHYMTKTLDDSTIDNLNEYEAKMYLKIYKDSLIKLYGEYKILKDLRISDDRNQKSLKTLTSKEENQNKSKSSNQVMKDRLRARIVEDENIKLKSEVNDYRNVVENMQKDLKILKKEITYMDSENKILQNEISNIKENTIGKKITKLFIRN